MIAISYLFLQLWATFATKLMKRPTIFFKYFETSTSFLHVYKITWLANKKKSFMFQYVNKTLFIPATLNYVFYKNYEKSYSFCNIFLKFDSICTLSRILSWPHFCNKNDGRFNIANKLLFISKGIFFTLCFSFLLFAIYFSKYLQLPLSNLTHWEKHVAQHCFLEDNATWKLTFFIFAFFAFSTLHDFSEKTVCITYFQNLFQMIHA